MNSGNNPNKKLLIYTLLLGLTAVLVLVYYQFDPVKSSLFVACPLKSVTGYDCPGCGSQRAFHALLHFRFGEAFRYNPLFVVVLILLVVWLLLCVKKNKVHDWLLTFLRSRGFIIMALIIVLLFSLFRNTDCYRGIFEH